MKLSIIIPAHNEQSTILQVLQKVTAVNLGQWEKEVIVVDDGSNDGTKAILKNLKLENLKIIIHPKNLGKGAAIKSALEKVTGDYVIIQDADLEYDPGDIPKLLLALNPHPPRLFDPGMAEHLLPEGEGLRQIAVFGNRGTKSYPERGFYYVVGAKLLTWTFNLLFGLWLKDLYTGYKLFPAAVVKNIDSSGFEFEVEITAKILKSGLKIKEIPISYHPRNREQGKHIGFKDAIKGFWSILRYRVK